MNRTNFMHHKSNKLANLCDADRDHILKLCSNNRYEDAVNILLLPRDQGGLDLLTSTSALCRFYKSHHPEPSRALLAQYAAAAQVHHEQNGNAFLGAIRASVEARVLESLKAGKALADLEKDIKLLKTTQSIYLADAEWRRKNPKLADAAYRKLVEDCARAPENEFYDDEDLNTLPACEVLPERTPFDQDILEARREQRLRDEHSAELVRILRSPGSETAPIPPSEAPKTRAIPHIPANSTSENSTAAVPPVSPETPASKPSNSPTPTLVIAPPGPVKPKPIVAPPKIGRNDACPCGSHRKYKKCCLTRSSPETRLMAA